MRALYSKPEHAPKETRSAEVIAATQRARDAYVSDIDFDAALHKALPQIKARTLIVMGTKDTVAPVIVAHRIKAGIANSHLSFIYGAAHALEFDAPDRVGPLIGRFLERGEAFVVPQPGRRMKQADLFNIKDHVAFVTGAASGLGLAYAEVMARERRKGRACRHQRGRT